VRCALEVMICNDSMADEFNKLDQPLVSDFIFRNMRPRLSDGDTNFGVTLLAAPNAAASSVARYSFAARLAACASSPASLL
jgi:hypothetical protein